MALTGCGVLGGGADPTTSPDYEPVSKTTTTEPSASTSSSTSPQSTSPPDLPDGAALVDEVKDRMGTMSSVTIDGVLYTEDGDPIDFRAEGSTGDVNHPSTVAGRSRSTLTLANGGTLVVLALGYEHFIKFDEKWFEGRDIEGSVKDKRAGRWLRIGHEDSPVDGLRPKVMLKGTFFGEGLTFFDAERVQSKVEDFGGTWYYRLDVVKAGEKGDQVPRTMWVTTDKGEPNVRRLTFGQHPKRSTFDFTRWNSSREDYSKPPGAKTLKDDEDLDAELEGLAE